VGYFSKITAHFQSTFIVVNINTIDQFFFDFFSLLMNLDFIAESLTNGATTHSHCSPVVLLSMLDHFTRCENDERAIGVLLGYRLDKPNHVQINNTFPLKYTFEEEKFQLDLELMNAMVEAQMDSQPDEEIVGWYLAGGQIDLISHEIHKEISGNVRDYQATFVYLDIDSLSQKTSFPIQAFVSTPVGLEENPGSLFLEIPCETEFLDSSIFYLI
jgi:translation initiation factor 3 subunit F